MKTLALLVAVLLVVAACRARSDAPPTTDLPVDPAQRAAAAYKRGTDLIEPHMKVADRATHDDGRAQSDLREGLAYMDIVVGLRPDNFAAWWVRGKAQQALNDHESAYDSFRRSYAINDQNPDVGRELVSECLQTGRTGDAVRIARALTALAPGDAGLLANLALTYVLDGRLDEAARTVDASIAMAPSDAITARLRERIDDIRSGRRPRPKTLADLQR